jgi:hypothetical protein
MDATGTAAEQQLPPVTSGKAIASLVLGICSFCTVGITGIIGLILGIAALGSIKREPARIKGSGLAIAGIIVSCVSFMFVLIQVAIFLPALTRAQTQAKRIASLNNLHQLSIAAIMYTEDNDGKFPPSANWPEAMWGYYKSEKILQSPLEPTAGRAYAMNANLDNRTINQIISPHRTVLFFECRFGSPPGGGPELLPDTPRAGGSRGYVFSFVDSHSEGVQQERLDQLKWDPYR